MPLALIALATLVHRRSKAGVRAAICLTLGIFGVVASAEGWYYTFQRGASGDDYTGLLTLPAGLVLLLSASIVLWTSRRRGGHWLRRYARRGLIAVAGVLSAYFLVVPFMFAYGYTHIARSIVPPSPFERGDYETVNFRTSDGLDLTGWYHPSENGAVVICFAGRATTQDTARFLARHGYGVLIFDRRGEGESEGDPNAFGWGGEKDIQAAIAFLHTRADVDPERIGGIGFSVGGEMMLEAAASSDDLRAVVSEGAGIRSFREATSLDVAQGWYGWPIWTSTTLGTAIFSNSLPPSNLKDLAARIAPRPVFLIYADKGQGGEHLSESYYRSAGEPKSLWKTPSAHIQGYTSDPEGYEKRVVHFFDQALRH
jgi:hypothetical protein